VEKKVSMFPPVPGTKSEIMMTNAEDGAVLRPRTINDERTLSLLWIFIKVVTFGFH
jgi:hypothetical protein